MGKNKSREKVSVKQILGTALQYFNDVDQIDLNMFVADIKQTKQFLIVDELEEDKQLSKVISHKDDKIVLSKNKKKKEILEKNIPSSLYSFFKKRYFSRPWNGYNHEERKNYNMTKEKEKIKGCSNILVISNNKDDYQVLKEYGFERIDYVPTLIDLERLVRSEENLLNQYNVIVFGKEYFNKDFTKHFQSFKSYSILKTIYEGAKSDFINIGILENVDDKLNLYMQNNILNFSWTTGLVSEKDAASKIADNLVANKVLAKKRDYSPIKKETKQTKIPIKNREIKVLVLGDNLDYKNDFQKQTGLDVTCRFDTNNNLLLASGQYDIIIASQKRLDKVRELQDVIMEQCLLAKRPLSLFLAYDAQNIMIPEFDENILGQRVNFKYLWFGQIGKNLNPKTADYYEHSYKFLRKQWQRIDYSKAFQQQLAEVASVENLLKETVRIYNAGLLRANLGMLQEKLFVPPRIAAHEFLKIERTSKIEKEITLAHVDKLKEKIALRALTGLKTFAYQNERYPYEGVIIGKHVSEQEENLAVLKLDGPDGYEPCVVIEKGGQTYFVGTPEQRGYLTEVLKQADKKQTINKPAKVIKTTPVIKEPIAEKEMPLQEAIDNIKDYERMLHFNKVGLLARLQGKRKDKLGEEKLYLTRKNQLYQVATFDFDKIYDFMAEVLSRMTNEDFTILNYNMVTCNYPFINPSFPMPTIQSVKILTSEHEAKEINKVIEDFNYSINSLEAIKMYPHIGLIYSDKLLIFDFNKVNILADLTNSYPKLKPYLEQLINVRLENPEISEDEAYNKVLETKLSQEVKRVRQID